MNDQDNNREWRGEYGEKKCLACGAEFLNEDNTEAFSDLCCEDCLLRYFDREYPE